MQIVEPDVKLLTPIDESLLRQIELAARTCYKSVNNGSIEKTEKFVHGLIEREHEAMIEHAHVSIRVICDRGVSHEIVRHRVASYAQESTRYCNYSGDRFGNEITVIRPPFWEEGQWEYNIWYAACRACEEAYMKLLELGATPQEARDVLPTSLKTEIVITMNFREWRHFFKLRCAPDAHPQMRQVALRILKLFREKVPILVSDIPY